MRVSKSHLHYVEAKAHALGLSLEYDYHDDSGHSTPYVYVSVKGALNVEDHTLAQWYEDFLKQISVNVLDY